MNAHDLQAIAALDLEPIKVKLMHQESGEGWTLARANAVEFEYRRFLYLMKKYPNEQTAPLVDVDTFWHYHILDTMKYAVDCDAVFGHFLHHFPYIGLRGEDDEAAHRRVGLRMQELYEDTFGEDYVRAAAPAATAHSGVAAADFAHSGVAAQFAHSGVAAADIAHSGVAGAQANAVIAAAQQSGFYSQRPRLPA
nr:glycine-rich domain-containing protein-like [uncultured Duganella sp.]